VAEPIDTVVQLVLAINRGDLAGAVALYELNAVLVLRRQRDGHWLIALDNPWGAQILSSP